MSLTTRERATAALYGELHRHATETFARDYLLPGLRLHLEQLGLDPDRALAGAAMLDGGCGGFAGGADAALALGARTVTGVDLSAENVRSARERFADEPGARFVRANLLSLPFASEQFDFVYSNGVLMITEDPERAFRELVRMTKPGGRIYIGVYGRGGLYNEIFVPLAKLGGRLVPQAVTRRLLRLVPRLLRPSSSLMDVMYVPIEIHYRIDEIRDWFAAVGLEATFLRHYYQPPTWLNRLLFGDGTMIFFSAVKPRP